MLVHAIALKNYRNYESLTLTLDEGINIFLGANAQGKTNLLEAICYASLGRSHRTHQDADLIRFGEEAGSLQLAFSRFAAKSRLDFLFARGKRRSIRLNGEPIRMKELIGTLNTVLFSPEDLFLIKGAPAERRRFLDGEISQASPAYYHELATYQRLVAQRNALLKRIRERRAAPAALESWEPQLAASAARVTAKRLEVVRKLSMLANLMQRRISGSQENLALSCAVAGHEAAPLPTAQVTKTLEAWYNEKLRECRDVDIARGATTVGPHRDDLVLEVNGVNLRAFGSQGQQRTGALSLKLSELEFLRSETGEYPILLLDDVMSELDADRRQALLAFLRKERIQTIITATDAAYFPRAPMGSFYRVEKGRVERSS